MISSITPSGVKLIIESHDFQEFEVSIINKDGPCSAELTESDVAGFNEDTYVSFDVDACQTIRIGNEHTIIEWLSGSHSPYKGRNSGEETNLSVFRDASGKKLPTNDYYFFHEELETFYYGERKDAVVTLNEAFVSMGFDLVFDDEDAKHLYDWLHQVTPTQATFNIETDKHLMTFVTESAGSTKPVAKLWGELAVGDAVLEVDRTSDRPPA